MTTFSFSLHTGETGPLVKGSEPDRLRIPIPCHTPILSEGDQVLAGTKIAVANHDASGDMHAPLPGIIKDILPYSMLIEVSGEGRAETKKPPTEGGETLKEWLRDLGLPVRNLNRSATLIINAVPPEPGISIYEPLLRDYRKTLELGLETAQRIVESSKIFLAAAKGNRANAFANCKIGRAHV